MVAAQSTSTLKRLLTELSQARSDLALVRARRTNRNTSIPSTWEEFAPLLQIKSGGEVVPFRPYGYQRDLIRSIEDNQSTIICKSRQMGISETLCSYLLFRCLSEPGFSAAVFSKTQSDSSQLGKRIRYMTNSLKDCPPYETESNTELTFAGYGSILFLPVTSRAARGIPSCSVVIFDEAGFIDGIEGVYQAAQPTLAMLGDKGKVIFNSTPNGSSGLYYDLWTDEDSDWNKVRLHYSQHPVYGKDPDWAERTRQKRKLTRQQWNQEYELDFASSDANVFNPKLVEDAAVGKWQPEGYIDRTYILGVDPNGGGNDAFCAVVLDVTEQPYQVVHMYHQAMKTVEYSMSQIYDIIENYQPSMIRVEKNGMGSVIIEQLISRFNGLSVEPVVTTTESKRIHTDRLVLLLEQHNLQFPPDCKLRQEMKVFRQDERGKRAASSGHHDDAVMATAIACSGLQERAAYDSTWLSLL